MIFNTPQLYLSQRKTWSCGAIMFKAVKAHLYIQMNIGWIIYAPFTNMV